MRALLVVACALSLFPGCVTLDQALLRRTAFVAQLGAGSALSVRKTPRNPLQNELNLLGWQGPSPSERTYQVLRRFGLEGVYHQDPQDALGQLRTIVASEPHLEPMYALAELSYIQGFKAKSAQEP
ncbi:MAG: hypothetical protein R3B96_24340 [Pirellulaceae bacterium]